MAGNEEAVKRRRQASTRRPARGDRRAGMPSTVRRRIQRHSWGSGPWVATAWSRECAGGVKLPTQDIEGARVSIYPGTSSDLVFDIGCHCTIGLNVEGNRATISPTPAEPALFGRQPRPADQRQLHRVSLERTADGLSFSFAGARRPAAVGHLQLRAGRAVGPRTLVRTGHGAVRLRAPETQVGIIPIGGYATSYCPLGAGLAGIRIKTHDEDDPPCSASTGGHGEGRWVLPDDHRDSHGGLRSTTGPRSTSVVSTARSCGR